MQINYCFKLTVEVVDRARVIKSESEGKIHNKTIPAIAFDTHLVAAYIKLKSP